VRFADQSADDLRWQVYQDLDVRQFNCLATASLLKGIRVNATIIGASHVIEVHGKQRFFEVVACVPGRGGRLRDQSIAEINEPKTIESLAYHFTVDVQDYEQGQQRLQDLMAIQADHDTLAIRYEFPSNTNQIPITLVTVSHNAGNLEWQTVHSYPNEGKIVFTQTNVKGKINVPDNTSAHFDDAADVTHRLRPIRRREERRKEGQGVPVS